MWLFIFRHGWTEDREHEEIFETSVFIFLLNSSIFFRISVDMQFWFFNMEKYTLNIRQLFYV